MKEALRIVMLGYVVRMPLGGMSWHYLNYVLAARKLGHEVSFMEFSGTDPWCCYDPRSGVNSADSSYGLAYATGVFDRLGMGDSWAYLDQHQDQWHGPLGAQAEAIGAAADLLINVSAANPIRPWFENAPTRIVIDTDPLFSQIRNLTDSGRAELMAEHNRFFSFGVNIRQGSSSVPSDGIDWLPTVQPVMLDEWPMTRGRRRGAITTIMQWDSYASRSFQGITYGMKALSFEMFHDLPAQTDEQLELALGSPNAPRELLVRSGWHLRDPIGITRDPWTYGQYIRQSKAEFSVAKHGYVASRSGWFSERSANYLASGRPVLTQDTGFTDWMETGTGVLPFSTLEGAVHAIADLNERYDEHCDAAREAAVAYFNSDRVLNSLIERATASEG